MEEPQDRVKHDDNAITMASTGQPTWSSMSQATSAMATAASSR
jgi:hypothetical protein